MAASDSLELLRLTTTIMHHFSMLHPVTLTWICWQISASSEPVTPPVTPPALVPPQNSSALEAPQSQLHINSQDSWNLVPCFELRYHQYHPQYYCLKFNPSSNSSSYSCSCSVFWHSIPVFPLLYSSPCCVLTCIPIFPVPNGYALWLMYIDPHLV